MYSNELRQWWFTRQTCTAYTTACDLSSMHLYPYPPTPIPTVRGCFSGSASFLKPTLVFLCVPCSHVLKIANMYCLFLSSTQASAPYSILDLLDEMTMLFRVTTILQPTRCVLSKATRHTGTLAQQILLTFHVY